MIEYHSLKGLLHASLLDGKGGSRDFEWSSVSSWTPEQGCLWLPSLLNKLYQRLTLVHDKRTNVN